MRALTALSTLCCLALATPAGAQSAGRKELLRRLFEAPEAKAEWFAPAFLAQVPAARVTGIIESLKDEYGELRAVTGEGQRFTVILDRAEVPTHLVLDKERRIAGLLFEPAVMGGSLEAQIEAIASLPGRTAVLVVSDGTVRAAHNADMPLAVGSAAKLAVLKATADAVAAGRLSWGQTVALDPAWRSLPTGILQDWPVGTPLTLASLANLMISLSDNTATDALIRLIGRERVEAVSPRNTPFPTTRELFTLKAAGNEALRAAWSTGDADTRRGILDEIAETPLPAADALETAATTGVEWFFTARELCTLMEALADLPALHINPGLAAPGAWLRIAYKGGSETGVLNYTTRLEGSDGTTHCVVATWNDEGPLDEGRASGHYRAMLRELRGGA